MTLFLRKKALLIPRRKVLLGIASSLAAPAIIRPSRAQVPMTGAGLAKPATGGGGGVTWTQTDSNASLSNTEPTTWTAANIGAANANRVVVVFWRAGTNVLSGVTIGGVSATLAIDESSEISGFDIWYASLASGTTANIVFSAGGNFDHVIAICGRLITTTPTPAHVYSNAANTNPNSLAVTVPTGGIALAAIDCSSGVTITWTNASLDVAVPNGGSQISQAETSSTGSMTASGDTSTSNHMVGAAWGP